MPRSPLLRRLRTTSSECLIPTLGIEIGLLTGCQDRPYAFGLAMALVSKGVGVDVIGGDEIDSPELHVTPNLRFLNFRGNQHEKAGYREKIVEVGFLLCAADAVCGALQAADIAHSVE